ncbi:hypothetical protein Tco_0352553 [Tanacetum coccineum]
MPTKMELTLEQTQQGVRHEVSTSSRVLAESFVILPEHQSEFIHNEDGNPAESNIKQAHGHPHGFEGYLKMVVEVPDSS